MNEPFRASGEYDEIAEHVHADYAFVSSFLDPNALTTQLEIQPSRAWTAGEQVVAKSYDPRTRTVIGTSLERRPSGLWAVDTKALLTKDPEQHLIHLLNLLEPKRHVIQSYLDDEARYVVRFYMWWEPFDCHGGYAISAKSLMRAATLCHRIDFGFISKPSPTEITPEPEHSPSEPA